MEIQFHPVSGRGSVRTFSIEEAGQRALIVLAAVLVSFGVSLWVTVPVVVARGLRQGEIEGLAREFQARSAERHRAADLARSLSLRALDRGDLFNRIAFLYTLPAGQWPTVLKPERGILAEEEPARIAAALELYLRGLERARVMIADREREDPDLARRVPAVVPIADALFEPSAFFGPGTSRWTGEEEFLLGVDFAAPGGSAVVAPGAGTVSFAGAVRRSVAGWFWRLGNVVVISHGVSGATVFGHLARIDVRRGQRVARGDRIGAVGATGWAISPELHYEYWRPEGEKLRPTDPLFATLNRRAGGRPLSLEQMEATSAPGPFDQIPGIGVSAAQAGERPETRGSAARRRRRRL